MGRRLLPFDLTWTEVDPRLHPFEPGTAPAVVNGLDAASRVPVRTARSARSGEAWTDEVTRGLVERFGRWATGWRWARDEGDVGGGPVGSWCCTSHSITTPAETLARVADGLCEWRAWLEDLAERFDRYPLVALPAEDRQDRWERAAVDLVTLVVDRTGAGHIWYVHCEQVLTWFLTRWGVDQRTAQDRVGRAVSGRFESWSGPGDEVLDDLAARLATSLRTGDQA